MKEGSQNFDFEKLEKIITNLKIKIEEDRRIEEILRSQLEENAKNDWKLGSRNGLFKERSSEERYATEEHQNIGSNNQ
jgi:hypothetical protein